ncbi:MAG TPA: ABC transporter ATP-binding protein [Acidimicrobiales bacterium]|nr:ABC transporter ATP-binding protein [Acidimicrobiales bacterium]
MILLDAQNLTVTRPDRPLFEDLSVTISTGDRIGVLGLNGSGKSTLLRILAGEDPPESGEIRLGRETVVSVLAQRPDLGIGTVRQAVGEGWEADSILDRLGMGRHLDTDVTSLSGGQAKRVALARALLTESNLLILDEPTNHLDIEATEWLEARLAAFRGGVVIVTHDRALLNRVTNRILSIDRDGWHLTEGGYRTHLAAEAERLASAEKAEASRRILARQELAWIQRGARARRRKPRSRLAQAREIIAGPQQNSSVRDRELALGSLGSTRLGKRVIDLHGVSFSYGDGPPVIEDLDLGLDPGARLGIIGPNGAGKSTLLDLMARRIEPTSGRVEWGSTVKLGYFSQQGRPLPLEERVRDVVAGEGRQIGPEQSALLERFWFNAEAQRALVGTLSGGERRRLELLLVLARSPNVLLFDEPTNDLDLDTLRSLEGFLDDWSGSLVVVSHDRVFLEKTAEVVLSVSTDGTCRFVGSGEQVWATAREGRRRRPGGGGTGSKDGSGKPGDHRPRRRSPSTLRRLIAAAEEEMSSISARRDELISEMSRPGLDHGTLASLGRELDDVDAELTRVEESWLALAVEAEENQGRQI